MINGRDRRRPGLLPGQRGGRCHRRPDRWQRLFESMSRPYPALDEIAWCCWRAAQPAGPRVAHSFQHPGASLPRPAGPQCLLEIVHGWWSIEGREPTDGRRSGAPTAASDRPHRRRPVLHNPPWCSPGGTGPSGQPTGRGGNCLESDEEDAAPPDLEVNLPGLVYSCGGGMVKSGDGAENSAQR